MNFDLLDKTIKRKHRAFINIMYLIELGILLYDVEISENAALEKMKLRFKNFPSFCTFKVEYLKDCSDDFQRYNMLIYLLQKHCLYIENMQKFLCRMSFTHVYRP